MEAPSSTKHSSLATIDQYLEPYLPSELLSSLLQTPPCSSSSSVLYLFQYLKTYLPTSLPLTGKSWAQAVGALAFWSSPDPLAFYRSCCSDEMERQFESKEEDEEKEEEGELSEAFGDRSGRELGDVVVDRLRIPKETEAAIILETEARVVIVPDSRDLEQLGQGSMGLFPVSDTIKERGVHEPAVSRTASVLDFECNDPACPGLVDPELPFPWEETASEINSGVQGPQELEALVQGKREPKSREGVSQVPNVRKMKGLGKIIGKISKPFSRKKKGEKSSSR